MSEMVDTIDTICYDNAHGNEVLPWETKTAFKLMTSAIITQKLSVFYFIKISKRKGKTRRI